jgi:nitrogenase molybdenum-iron protein alpha chain
MNREINHNVMFRYHGTLKGFADHICRESGPNKDREKKDKNKPVCDLTSCPIDGAYLTLSKIDSLVILFHSPPGCSMGLWILWGGAYSLKSVTGTKKESGCITLCTNMNERDVIYGGMQKLKMAVVDIKERFNPEHCVILSSCCAGIIGDDIEEVVAEARKNLGMDIGWVDSCGFKSTYWPNGYDLAHRYIVEHIMEPCPVDDFTINIIPYGNAASVDERECSRVLTKLGLTVQLPLSVPHTTLEKLKRAPAAKANAMMCMTFGWNFARAMQKRFNTAFSAETHPIGTHFTKKWLRSIAVIYGLEEAAEKLIAEELAEIEPELEDLKKQLKGRTVAISAGHDKAPALLAMCLEFGMRVIYFGILTYDDLVKEKIREVADFFDYNIDTVVFPQTYEEIPIIKKKKPEVFIGPAGLTPKNVMMQVPSVSSHFNDFIGPFFCFKGMINFGKEIIRAIRDPVPHYAPFQYLITGHERVCGEKWYRRTIERDHIHDLL